MKLPQKPIPRVSPKKASKGFQWPKRSAVKKRNPKRRASEFKRCYGSKERVEFVRGLPCAACGLVGDAVNAHVLGNGGMGRKADYTTIAPLCAGYKIILDENRRTKRPILGCHTWFDEYREQFDARFPEFDAEKAAAETQAAWIAHSQEKA